MQQLGPPQNLLEAAARACFWKLPMQTLQKVARSVGVQCQKGQTVLDCLRALIEHVFVRVDLDTLKAILAKRCQTSGDRLPSNVDKEVVESMLEKQDAKDMKDL